MSDSTDDTPRETMSRMLCGFWTTQAVSVAVHLKVPDLLANGPQPLDQLAKATGCHERSLFRLLRALSSSGVFAEDASGRYSLTPLSDCLRRDAAGSLASLALMRGGWQYRAWGELLHSVRTGRPAFDHVFGETLFEHLSQESDKAALFDAAMVGVHGRETTAMLAAYDFSGIKLLADIGGGNGSVLKDFLKQSPSARGVLFDRSDVVERARTNLQEAGVAERCQFVAGDFFVNVPAGADAYLLRHIIHDWNDEQSLTILKSCRAAMSATSRLLIAEFVLPDTPGPFFGKWFDLSMLAITGGQERTTAEYAHLLVAAGLQLQRIVPTESELSVIEATV